MAGTLVLAVFNLHIKKHQDRIAETFYEIEPETEEDLLEKELEKLAQQEQVKAETNQAFNENQKSKSFAQAYRRIEPPKDYVRPDLSQSEYGISSSNIKVSTEDLKVEKEERKSFSKVNDVLNKQLKDDLNNEKSTVSYSLTNRKHRFLPTPIYLCETGGKIVINITVNGSGKVIDSYYNNASNSANQCLIEHALEYAKKARFNSDNTIQSQIGSITFYFEGKP
ncbi:hypothetical protein ACFS5M_04025 [Lacinutrix iliipiscaria]|uniref:TonB family protein n=1 Tax=Lacinutrix iliipiscaria TaxID=1230532 RepID=A0ABW5WLJ6_9FLAO